MKKLNDYLIAHKTKTLTAMWIFFAVALGYMLVCLLACPTWPFWLCLIPGLIAAYLRVVYAEAARSADPAKARRG